MKAKMTLKERIRIVVDDEQISRFLSNQIEIVASDGTLPVLLIPLKNGEMVEIMKKGHFIDCAFGVGGVSLKYDTALPMSDAVDHLLMMRGILNENMHGAGI